MADMDERTLRGLAAKAGLPMQFVYKEIKLFEVLAKILSANKEADLDIIMKGGTALNKIYLPGLQRFSEDIDFDLFSEKERLGKILSVDGFELEGPWRIKNTVRYHLKYIFLGKEDFVRVEFSTNKLRKIAEPIGNENMVSDFTGTVLYGVPCYSFNDILARKMNALRTRCAGKDVWDCYQAMPKAKNLKKAIDLALQSERLELSAEESLQQTLAKLKKADLKTLMKLTNSYIPTSIRPKDWKEVIEKVIFLIENL